MGPGRGPPAPRPPPLPPLLLLTLGLWAAPALADMDGHFDPAKCRYALGMQDRTIPDSDISASSSWSDSTAARHSRLESSDGDGAWCPAEPVFPAEAEYLQVDLRRLHLVALVGTQGRHAGGLGKEFSPGYRLRYSRDGHRWMSWKDRWGQEVISGNEDPGGVVLKDLGPPLVARLVRFYPRADRLMSVCLRVELYGCLWKGFSTGAWATVSCGCGRATTTWAGPTPASPTATWRWSSSLTGSGPSGPCRCQGWSQIGAGGGAGRSWAGLGQGVRCP
uniref:Discoidin domain receptor tyrosine kinase 1 n=1 Tax=Ornithorhynchus anatinus TaxID=9258 RepID=K7EF47_ORNAN